MLPAKNKLPRDTVKTLGVTLGAINSINEPMTQRNVNGTSNMPRGIVTHLGNGVGSISFNSLILLMPNRGQSVH